MRQIISFNNLNNSYIKKSHENFSKVRLNKFVNHDATFRLIENKQVTNTPSKHQTLLLKDLDQYKIYDWNDFKSIYENVCKMLKQKAPQRYKQLKEEIKNEALAYFVSPSSVELKEIYKNYVETKNIKIHPELELFDKNQEFSQVSNALFNPVSGKILIPEDNLEKHTLDSINEHKKFINNIINVLEDKELKNKVSSLSDKEFLKFYKCFQNAILAHELQHFKQLSLIVKVYGSDEILKLLALKGLNYDLDTIYDNYEIPRNHKATIKEKIKTLNELINDENEGFSTNNNPKDQKMQFVENYKNSISEYFNKDFYVKLEESFKGQEVTEEERQLAKKYYYSIIYSSHVLDLANEEQKRLYFQSLIEQEAYHVQLEEAFKMYDKLKK